MSNIFAGKLLVTVAEDSVDGEEDVLIELYDFRKDGLVELAFDLDHRRRVYLKVPLPAMMAALAGYGSAP